MSWPSVTPAQAGGVEPALPGPARPVGRLPLLERAGAQPNALVRLTREARRAPGAPSRPVPGSLESPRGRMPVRAPAPGEQYRFHVDMGRCIGCKCCVVACNEQNGNPAHVNWRRVAEVEGGWHPAVLRASLSMACNHCLDPACLAGCPVDAYTKDPATGIVRHDAETCIGCQYCTWNCSYGVPQYNAERGVVGKCDMCHGRLAQGDAPACVAACPEGAIEIEIVNAADWRTAVAAAAARPAPAGLPVADGSVSTTRVTMPGELPPGAAPRDLTHVAPDHPHWPLVLMTVLTQFAVGAFVTVWLLQLLGASARLEVAALASLAVGTVALAASTLHLGRPAFAFRALRMWRRAWLSREVLLFTAFSAVAAAYAGMLALGLPGSAVAGGLTALLGAAGVAASACIYRVPSRPSWHTPYTPAQFALSAALLGPLAAAAAGAGDARWLALAATAMAGAQLAVAALSFFRCAASDSPELRGTARLLSTVLARRLVVRALLLMLGAIVVPLAAGGLVDAAGGAPPVSRWEPPWPGALFVLALALALAGEIAGRYLFFVSAVPRHMTAAYIPAGGGAACD